MLAKSGAKVLNPVGKKKDLSLLDTTFEDLGNQIVNRHQLRKISIESLGVLPMKDSDFTSAKKSLADHNYMNAEESKRIFDVEYRDMLDANLEKMIANMENKNWKGAADEMLDSKWAKQTPNRANRLADIVREHG